MEEPNWSVFSVSAASVTSGLTFTNTQHCRGTRGPSVLVSPISTSNTATAEEHWPRPPQTERGIGVGAAHLGVSAEAGLQQVGELGVPVGDVEGVIPQSAEHLQDRGRH